jgi:hypothetical protein
VSASKQGRDERLERFEAVAFGDEDNDRHWKRAQVLLELQMDTCLRFGSDPKEHQ